MSEKVYITRDEGEALSFNYDYKQVFHHESSQPKTLPEYALIKWFVKQPEQPKQMMLEVLGFIYKFTFATRDQLERMLRLKGIDAEGLDGILQKLLDQRMANFCYFSKFDQGGPVPDDAFRVYCLDFGAVGVLSHFYCDNVTWFSTDAMVRTELVLKYLTTTLFYLSMAEARGKALQYFKPVYDVTIGHRDIRFSAAFAILQGHTPLSFILESVRAYDLPSGWDDKVDKKIVPFACQDKYWTKYFSDAEPVYIFLVEDEEQALETARIFYRRTGKDNFRLITDGQLKGGLDKAVFLKYIPNAEDPVKTGTLKKVKSSLLSGDSDDN